LAGARRVTGDEKVTPKNVRELAAWQAEGQIRLALRFTGGEAIESKQAMTSGGE